ncbi:phenylalanine--tRNA ligase subunit beta [Candidatus Pantoea edessiphila]|uniref:Phenylalanine--tRNA ligase beta subunit n=1 Tax=Candidatus Pantoea edessiphila TaxID=2044610 RepID=A0A2P5SWV1_9GAMM|nr:phenylalanine--tRNA ligase subunit beta [Candidatus Pantoea edessiphila]PPI86809.1 phenylalanine--tRNA ligase subunit beta [Candidatus Pantoea edessiphila]
MKFSELWLRQWVNPNLSTNVLCEQITMLGLEVENVSVVSNLFHGIVTGVIIDCKNKSNFNKIKLLKVNIGDEQILNIACDSINCRLGLKVAVATSEDVLPGNKKFKILKDNGIKYEGVICSFFDLGISDADDCIIELPPSTPIGKDVYSYLQLNDNIIEINITPNRADCLSIIGISRDIAALYSLPLKDLQITPIKPNIDNIIPIYIKEKKACPRYLARVIKDININITTPLWIKEKLRRCGIPSINVVIDINNYILMEIGQPISVFDIDCVDQFINIRMAENDEKFTLLHGARIDLNNNILVIADQNKVLSIAGICIDSHSNISNKTQNILLESAYFNPSYILNNVRSCNLNSDISYRYERGIDHKIQCKALEYATKLLLDICGGQAGPIINHVYNELLPVDLKLNLHRMKLDRLIGFKISDTKIEDILKKLGFIVHKKHNYWTVEIPSWRVDIFVEEDLIEEVIRIFGYNNIPNVPIKTELVMMEHPENILSLKRAKNLLVDKGYQEVITYSFVDPKKQKLINPQHKAIFIINPISQDMSVMRTSIWTGLINILTYNQNHQQNRIRLFESGYCFTSNENESDITQTLLLAAIISGNKVEDHWDCKSTLVDFYDLKGDLESLLQLSKNIEQISFKADLHFALHPGKSAAIYLHDKKIGFIGAIHPNLQNKFKIKHETIIFELLWNELSDCKSINKEREISPFPINRRDISIIVNENIPTGDIITLCKKIGINQLVGINLLDVYRGKGISKGYKSLTISLILQDTKRTLKEEEIAIIVNKYIMALKKRFQVTLRN